VQVSRGAICAGTALHRETASHRWQEARRTVRGAIFHSVTMQQLAVTSSVTLPTPPPPPGRGRREQRVLVHSYERSVLEHRLL
jgi:hypothetical protein